MSLPILLVDDEQDAGQTAAEMLRTSGYEVDVALNGPAGLKMVEDKRYALAIIDYQMPGMNGVELFRRIRQLWPDMLGIFLTGYTTIDVVYPAIEAGILRVLPKPVDFKELLSVIAEHVGGSERMRI
jgi:DNA-binding response OmpR family regulator